MGVQLILASAIVMAALLCCAGQTPFAGNIYWPSSTNIPKPVAFYPLTDGTGANFATWPAGQLNGASQNTVTWDADDKFGFVPRCSREVQDTLYLDSAPYGHSGTFAVNLWFKLNTTDPSGLLFGYLFSQTANSTRAHISPTTVFHENTLALFLPQSGHPAYGLLRSVVKDSDDTGDNQSFIDSDGQYNNNNLRASLDGITDVSDGNWHMATLTSQPNGSPGFQMYVDGRLAGQLAPTGYDAGTQTLDGVPTPVYIDGGNPLLADTGDIFLCGRSDMDPSRHFSGHVAHVSIYDAPLDATSIGALYNATAVVGPAAATASASSGKAPDALALLLSLVPNGALQTPITVCGLNTTQSSCQPNFSCAPLSSDVKDQLGADSVFAQTGAGVCASPTGVFLPLVTVPTPSAYFPLTNGYGSAWPLDTTAANMSQVSWVDDSTFGQVVDCSDVNAPEVTISNLHLGAQGPFAVNLWMQQGANPGQGFQYLFSAGGSANGTITADSIFYPNQVHLYFPEAAHPAAGLARAIVADSTDAFQGETSRVWLDSDNTIGSNNVRTTSRVNFTDGSWHMVTLTTHATGGKGYELYVDGNLLGSLDSAQNSWQVDGGSPIAGNPPVVLCGRSDHAADRHFNGKVTQLGVWDTALTQQHVMALWAAVTGTAPSSLATLVATEVMASPAAMPASPDVDPTVESQPEASPADASPAMTDTASPSESPASSPMDTSSPSPADASPSLVEASSPSIAALPGAQASPSPATDGATVDPVPLINASPTSVPATDIQSAQPSTGATPVTSAADGSASVASSADPTTPATPPASKAGLPAGGIAGIVVAAAVVVVAASAMAVFLGKRGSRSGFVKEQLNDEEAYHVGDGLPSASRRSDKNRLFSGRDSTAHVDIKASAL